MHKSIIKQLFFRPLIITLTLLTPILNSCGTTAEADTPFDRQQNASEPLSQYQKDLLDLAFDAATQIPVDPHIKDRSRTQEAVVLASIELGRSDLALGYIDGIVNWRRGSCFADLAFYHAQTGDIENASKCIQAAERIADTADDWRKDRIRVKIAQTYTLLRQHEKARLYSSGAVESETGKTAAARATIGDEGSFDEQMQNIDSLVALGNFDILKNALEACAQLFNSFYSNSELRTKAEEKIKTSWNKLPIVIRMELLMEMADSALAHSDKGKALELINEAQAYLDGNQWPLENQISLSAQIIERRYLAGDAQKARSDAQAALALYKERRKEIVNIWRAGALRPLAQAFQTMGDSNAALSIYKLAVEEGMENPNSRPRAEDLSATCLSMALNAVEPDAELWTRVHEILRGLGQPW